MDRLEATGQKVDAKELARILGVPVVPIVAPKGEGLDELRKAIGSVLPSLDGKMQAMAMRVPVADGSATDLVVTGFATRARGDTMATCFYDA